jgi:molybdopterin-containing oxidoreductase family iron-sulfur binding subunit
MGIDRRGFFKAAGLAALGLAGAKPAIDAISSDASASSESEITGKRWAMAIDLRKYDENTAKRCIEACHHMHNVPKFDNAKDEIKWIWTEEFTRTFPNQEHQFIDEKIKNTPVPVLCNHCDNPPCVRVCPTNATFRRDDGIVVMDWHRCIGCRYCVAACPYGSRSFNWRDPRPFIEKVNTKFPTRMKGVVEKCTFCDERLAINKQPYCVEACQNKEMLFGDLSDEHSEIRQVLKTRFSIRRKPGLGTKPEIYYLV